MILLFCIIALAQSNWSSQIDNIESSTTQLKYSLQQLQLELAVSNNENIPVVIILSKIQSITLQIENLQKQINQMDKQSK